MATHKRRLARLISRAKHAIRFTALRRSGSVDRYARRRGEPLLTTSKSRVVRHSKFGGQCLSWVMNGPTRTVSVESALPRTADIDRQDSACPFSANNRLLHCNKQHLYSITSSATASSDGGTVMPSILAVWALMTKSNLDACTIGRSAGLSPLRMRPV